MLAMFSTPTDWKSEAWWRNRPSEERLFHAHIPPRYSSHPSSPVTDLVSWEPGGNYLITGPSGAGKSLYAGRLLASLLSEHPVSGRWTEADDYVEMIKDSFNNDGELPEMYSNPHLVKMIKASFDVVVLDGLGQERRTDFAVHELGSLIRKRAEKMKSTIITTSMPVRELNARYGERIKSILSEYEVVKFGGR
jgi:DNA replication protein DnaC